MGRPGAIVRIKRGVVAKENDVDVAYIHRLDRCVVSLEGRVKALRLLVAFAGRNTRPRIESVSSARSTKSPGVM
jgi:hypothetical protein